MYNIVYDSTGYYNHYLELLCEKNVITISEAFVISEVLDQASPLIKTI